jgi:hypothetical protein
MQWQQQQQQQQQQLRNKFGLGEQDRKFGIGDLAQKDSPLDLRTSTGDLPNAFHPFQQQLLLLKERDAIRLMTSHTMPPPPPPASSLALLRSFAALSEKSGFEAGAGQLAESHRALSALQQVNKRKYKKLIN